MQVRGAGIPSRVDAPKSGLDSQPAQADLAGVGDHDGVGTQPAVRDAALVRRLQCPTHLEGHDGGLLGVPALGEQVGPGVTHDPLGDDAEVAHLFDDVEDPDQAPVVDACGALGC